MLPCLNHATLMTTRLDQFLQAAASAGFAAVELRQAMLEEYLESHPHRLLRAKLSELGLSVASLNALMGWSLAPEENWDLIRRRAENLMALCEAIGTDLLVCVPSLIEPGMVGTLKPEEVREITAARLRRLGVQAQAHGIRLGLEQVGRPSSKPSAVSSVRRIEDTLEILKAAGQANLCLVIDSFNYLTGGNKLEALSSIPADWIGVLHAADAPSADPSRSGGERLMPGDGSLDLPGFAEEMIRNGYRGALSVELFNLAVWELPADQAAQLAMASIKRYL